MRTTKRCIFLTVHMSCSRLIGNLKKKSITTEIWIHYKIIVLWITLSIICQRVIQLVLRIAHTYSDSLTDICEVSYLFHIIFEISVKNQNFSLTLLCVQTRQSLFWTQSHHTPQLIKNNFHLLSILPRKWHQRRRQDSNLLVLDRRSMLCR